jgi:outer membrane lipoprotein-sorting protein
MGQLLVQRPYFFRCNYYTPYPLLITGGKKYVSIYDYEMDTITRLKANENIISVLFKNDWYNNDNFKIVETSEDEDNFIIKIFISESDQRSDVVFDKKSLNLVRISIFEMGEQNININFRMPLAVKSFKKGLFEIKDPATFGKPRQFNKEEIAQQYELN